MESNHITTNKLLASTIIAVLALSILSLNVPALSQDEGNGDDEEEENGEETEEEDEEEQEEAEASTEVKVKVDGNELEVEIEVESGLEDGEYEIVVDCENKPEAVEGHVLSGTLIVEDGKGEVKLEAELVTGEYSNCTLTFGEFSQEVAGFTIMAEETAEEEAEEESEVEATIVGTSSLVKVKVEFTSSSTDKESLIQEILAKVRLDEETISNALEIETEEDEELEEKVKVKVEIEDGKAEVEFEYRFVADSTDRESIVTAIVNKLQTLEFDEDDIELKVEAKGKSKVKGEFKAKAAKIAEEAREDAEIKGKPEFVENIDKAERFFGKSGKAVVGLKIGLESEDIESMSFGSAQLILIKMGEKEPMFRAVINILTDQPVDTLTACLDGQAIGQLTIIPATEELGISIGHLRENLSGVSITIPGVTVDIVEGMDCNAPLMLSGSL